MRRKVMRVMLTLTIGLSTVGADAPVRYTPPEDFNDVLLVATGRRVQRIEPFGQSDLERSLPMRPETRFEAGSISKWVASLVILRLVDRGLIDLDAPITRYLPDYRADTGAQLTLRTLMAHRSGLPNQVAAARNDPAILTGSLSQAEAVRRYASGDLRFAPGSDWDYSHSNWVLAKAVVETAAGRPYATLVDELIVRPLHLRNSGIFTGDSATVAGMAVGLARLHPSPERKRVPIPAFLAMAGGYYTDAHDLLVLMDSVLDRGFLSPGSRRALLAVMTPAEDYALGGRVRTRVIAGHERVLAWEDGTNGGFRVIARRVLADGHTTIVLSNASFDAGRLVEMGDALLEESYAQADGR